jgi:hypothetical protein
MSLPSPRTARSRPWEVTVGATQAVIGSIMMVLAAVTLAQQLESTQMRQALSQLIEDPRFVSLHLTLSDAQALVRYTLMAVGALSVTSLVLAVFVLLRHRISRIVLTALGGAVAVFALFGGTGGWAISVYVGVSIGLLWTRPAREWFARSDGLPSSVPPPPPPQLRPPPPPPPAPPPD